MLRFLWRFVAFLAEMNGYTPFFQALFKANLAIIVGGLSRSEWVGMLRFRQFCFGWYLIRYLFKHCAGLAKRGIGRFFLPLPMTIM